MVDVLAGVGEVVFARCVSLAVGRRAGDCEGGVAAVVVLFVVMGVSQRGEGGEAHGHQFDEEEDEDGHERYAFGPVVFCYGAREARVCEGIAGGGEEVDERGGYDDAGAKVLGDEECPLRDSDASVAAGVDWECGTCRCQ